MNYTTNYKLNKPERNEQFNLDDWNNNSDKIDVQMHTNAVNIATNASDISTIFTGLNTINVSDTNSVYYKLMKLIYPVGSLYWSANSVNPSELFGGNWVQIKDKFILACGDTYKTTGATGGASTVTLSISNMPSHTHSFTPSGSISNAGGHTHKFQNMTNTGAPDSDGGNDYDYSDRYAYMTTKSGHTAWYGSNDKITSVNDHTHTFSGITNTTGSSGSGSAFSIMPPYVVKYCFERIS